MKISIIVPVYNKEKYLAQCLDSLLSQTFTDFEIICINDCSTDSSLEIVNSYLEKDSRISLINLEKNLGLGFVRNLGIEKSKGEYLAWIDADDYIDETYLEELYNTAIKYKADVIKSNIKKFSDLKTYNMYDHKKCGEWTSFEDKLYIFDDFFGSCNNLIKRDLIVKNSIKFKESKMYFEDFIFILKICFFAEKVAYFNPKTFYNYRDVNDSLTTNPSDFSKNRRFESIIMAYNDINEFTNHKKISLTAKQYFIEHKLIPNLLNNMPEPLTAIKQKDITAKNLFILYLKQKNPKLLSLIVKLKKVIKK